MCVIIDSNDITPVEFRNGLYVKRDDLFLPFGEGTVNGGKLRQCFKLIESIKDQYKGVISCCSIYSPQAPITSAVANHFGMRAVICYGATNYDRLNNLPMPSLSRKYGAELRIVSTSGIHHILYTHAKRIAEKENLFVVDYGFNIIDHPDIMFSAVSTQVQNIPDKIDNLVVTCGSGITSTGILFGLSEFNKTVGRVILVATAPDRSKMINQYLNSRSIALQYEIADLFHQKGFKYEKKLHKEFDGIVLHPNYEAKTFDWMESNIDYKKEKTLFWIVGAEPVSAP